MGFLDRAKKLAEQARELAEQAKDAAEGALGEARARAGVGGGPGGAGGGGGGGSARPAAPADPRLGTPYRAGMLSRDGWRERGLTDPAAILPVADRERAGVPHSTKSEIVEEPFGMGRRWTAGNLSVGLFYQLYADQQSWEPPAGRVPVMGAGMADVWQATLPDGRSLVFLSGGGRRVVLESRGIDDSARTDLLHAVGAQLG